MSREEALAKDLKELMKFTGEGIDKIARKHNVSQQALAEVFCIEFSCIIAQVGEDMRNEQT